MNKLYTILLPIILLVGCAQQQQTTEVLDAIKASIVNETYAAVKNGVDVPVVPVNGRHKRADCPVGGWITQGDGHKSRCPDCDPPYASDFGAAKCCGDNCTCGDNCKCDAEGKCLDKPKKAEFNQTAAIKLSPAERSQMFKDLGLSWKTANGKCSPDCKCKVCTCMYPGQCLVEANRGNPVNMYVYETSCSGRSCSQQRKLVRTYSAPIGTK